MAGRGQHSSNWVSGISTRTMHQSTTPSLSQTIWPRWASRQFLTLTFVQTLLSVTFGYILIEEMKEPLTKVIGTLTQEDFDGAFQKLLERYNKCIAAGGDYFEGDKSFMCVLSIKVAIRKNSGNLFNDLVYIYKYIYCHPQTDCFVLSELFSVARHVGRSKPGSKPVQLYVRLTLRPLGQQVHHVG